MRCGNPADSFSMTVVPFLAEHLSTVPVCHSQLFSQDHCSPRALCRYVAFLQDSEISEYWNLALQRGQKPVRHSEISNYCKLAPPRTRSENHANATILHQNSSSFRAYLSQPIVFARYLSPRALCRYVAFLQDSEIPKYWNLALKRGQKPVRHSEISNYCH
jgi:hypothetical protein